MINMFLQRKAIYNLLQINLPRIESGELAVADLQAWQIENYRQQSTETLLARLSDLNISFGNQDFSSFAEEFEEPEELLNAVAKDREPLEQDKVFLLIFELWRRFFPEKRTLSIFCDELDYQMTQYDLENESDIVDILEYLLQILDENADKGLDPQEILQTMQTYCANELESFLFDYTLNQIEDGNPGYAAELVEDFYPYISDTIWFDYLKARIDFLVDPEEDCSQFETVITQVNKETAIELVEEILYFLTELGNHALFYDLAQKMFDLMQVETDFREFLEICYIYCDRHSLKEPGITLSEIYHRRKEIPSDNVLEAKDADLIAVQTLLTQF